MSDKEYVLTIYPEIVVERYIYDYWIFKITPADSEWKVASYKSETDAWETLKKAIDQKILSTFSQ